jgi:hypothetical protein
LWLTTEGPSETYRIKSLPCNLSTLSINFHILGRNGSSSSYSSVPSSVSVSEETCQFWYTLSKNNSANPLETIMNLGGCAMSVGR